MKKNLYLPVEKSTSHISENRTVFTNDGIFLEEGIVDFSAANLVDEFTDVEQVVSSDSQLKEKLFKISILGPSQLTSSLHGPVRVT